MRVALVYPPIDIYTSYWLPHLGLGYLAAVLEKAEHEVEVIDCVAEKLTIGDLSLKLSEFKPQVVGITATTCEISDASEVAKMVKEINPEITTVVGGAHVTALPKKTLEEFPHFDVGIFSEGEMSFVALAEKLEKKKGFRGIPNLAFRENSRIVLGPSEYLKDLDSLPFPAWEKFDLTKYKGVLGFFKKLELPITSGRGCPHRCVFCQRAMGGLVRLRSPKNVILEIERGIALGAKTFNFCDDTFTVAKGRVLEICQGIVDRGLQESISWVCETRVDSVDGETLIAMKRAGCKLTQFGVESGDPKVLKHSNKKITLPQVRAAFSLSRKIGLKTYMFLIFGLPYETEDSIKRTIDFLMEVAPDYVTIGILVPFPGTEVLEMAKKNIGGLELVTRDWDDFQKQFGQAIRLKNLPSAKLQSYQSLAYRRFYLRPSRIINLFKLASFGGILNMATERIVPREAE